ncbi:MAG TPA: phosphoglycerate kinase [Candidatus Hydrogenedentes bacterium]|nr:phosphoglycerate kinase [Candidatus Hydrogenedentota bacterium]
MDLQSFTKHLRAVVFADPALDRRPLEDLLDAIPGVADLTDMPAGTAVLVRADLDTSVKDGKVKDTARIEACAPTIAFCCEMGWKPVVFGHIGRDRANSTRPIRDAMQKQIERKVVFIEDWLDEEGGRLNGAFVAKVAAAEAGTPFLLENTRKYAIETALWGIDEAGLAGVAPRLYAIARDMRHRLTAVEINEAIAASNTDFSSSVVPLFMDRTAFGSYIAEELKTSVREVRKADCVVFSGLKIDKLDALEGIVERGAVKMIIAGGSIAMALIKARAQLEGRDFFLGLAETDPAQKAYIPAKRTEQAQRLITRCRDSGIAVVLPADFVLENGVVSGLIPEGHAQMDIGPETRSLFAETLKAYARKRRQASEPCILFYNGVLGKFEEPAFAEGTKAFVGLLKELKDAGVAVYVGGGEGRKALETYGRIEDVTHAFTCGGTILKSLTNRHIAFLKAMYLQNRGLIDGSDDDR